MSESSSFPSSEPTPPSAFVTPSPAPRKSRRTLFFVLGGIAGAIFLCVALAAVLIGRSILSIASEQAAIAPVVDHFMQAMAQRDANAAYQLFSSRAQRQTTLANISKLLDGANYVLFDGYQSVAIDSTNLTNAVNTNPDVPQGTVAEVSGKVSYRGGVTGTFRATLEKEGDAWRLFSINVVVPPDKLQPSS